MNDRNHCRMYFKVTALCAGAIACGGLAFYSSPSLASDVNDAPEGLEEVCAAAKSEGGSILWYESSLPEQADRVIEAFMASYPDLEVEHVRSAGGQSIPAMIIQESQANVRSADVATGTYDQGKLLNDRSMLAHMTPEELSITEPALLPVPYGVVTANTFTAAIYNTDQVDQKEVPDSWEGFADEKWQNRLGIFQRGGQFFADWYVAWGEERTEALLDAIVQLNPVLAESTFTLAEDIGAGVRPIGIGLYHTGLQVQNTGAPIGIEVLEPVAVMPIATYVLQSSQSPMSSRCFAGWLATQEGALAYEDATLRGNHLIEGTQTFQVLDGKELAGWDFEEIGQFAELTARYNEILSR